MISRLLLFPAIYGIIAIAGSVVVLILIVVIWCRCTKTRSMNIKSPVSVKTVSNFCHYIKRNCFSKIKIAALKPGTFGVIFRILTFLNWTLYIVLRMLLLARLLTNILQQFFHT